MIYLLALLIGIVASLRSFTAPAAVAWAVHFGWMPLEDTSFAFLGRGITPWILGILALGELITDKLPATPSRKIPMALIARLIAGGFSGAAIGATGGILIAGLVLGIAGAAIGTFGGHACRMRLAAMFGRDLPAALVEDAVAVGGALLIVGALT
ncbi:DUF4126 domain-containing protein [Emcibacter sp. SYSU 3D8]|uniref:DUF4126 domain-containing protein n=1 Tax=Emcibacter sp. SYSU 3D8 TaxID=3133969 RepID=UPI0031FED93B